MFEDKNYSKLEGLKKGLYSAKNVFVKKDVSGLHSKNYDVKTDWEKEAPVIDDNFNNNQMPIKNKSKKEKNFVEKFLIFSSVLFFVAAILVLFTIFGGINNISTSNVDISVIGPATIESGGELSLQISIENKNSTDLELVDLVVKYPKGTRSVSGESMEKFTEPLGTIRSGKEVKKEVKAVLYGEENSEQQIVVSLEYRIADSNAIFFKERSFDLKISSSPVNLVISPIEESISGQEVNFSVSVISNTKGDVNDLLLTAEYPFGFEFISSDPKPDFSDNAWKIDGEKQVINIKGIITGQEGDERVFKFTCGTPDDNNEKKISAIFAIAEKSLEVKRPFLGIDLAINGDSRAEYILAPNKPIRVDVTWKNNSPEKILDAEISVKLKGTIINKTSINVEKGFYRSTDNTIVWDKRTNADLAEVVLGDSGRFSFYFEPVGISTRGSFVNPEISMEVSAKGNRVFENATPEEVISTMTRTIKISSDLAVTPRATYYSGPFTNSGSLPPQVEKETSYTITWTVTNTMNDISGVRVISSLPPYVRWLGVVSPSSEKISYNPVGGEISWNVGDVDSGTGINIPSKEISFQVMLLPSVSQIGQTPDLTTEVVVTGKDMFTNASLREVFRSVNTRLSTDPGFNASKANVVE
ncbi:TPA: hypothetical protein DCZ46_01730 [Candidatus Campbellbacteria bacterium]|nr:MAG: protein of unknown function with transmembrane region [Candidatus Campbellbacteria bacterium GW2011_OD1_34_28]KKP75202.1 MAG: hypothetical protein UR74_C0001G0058 [Candidatus Campbellbacteria bacterium GW2011_GWD2_35_24]KKP76237.1 MAG: hypothetical protein UR75_C0001G0271 [Candidatus Campbellbacteria bacterium GW2011_GWC2_35_28]KKP77426.1 MAG: hypothetical protein UR76_C0001G0271 [Candidatus Campbellbacteria bacterium GW2011_GWC1_35_31]KKP79355.1 MAG: hypothetical protein UR79_C0001G027